MLRLNNLIGLGAGGIAPLTLSFIASNSVDDSQTITLPATILAGDLLVLVQSTDSALASVTAVTPSGWTNLFSQTSTRGSVDNRVMIDYKIADGTEDGTSVTGMQGNGTEDQKVVLQFRGNRVVTAVNIQDTTYFHAETDPPDQVVNAASGLTPIIVVAVYGANAAVDPRGFSPAEDAEITTATDFFVKYKIYNSAPADTTVSMDDEGGNYLVSGYIQVSG